MMWFYLSNIKKLILRMSDHIKVMCISMVGFSVAELLTNPINVTRVVYQTNNFTLK